MYKKGFKTFNGQCYKECPINTYEKNINEICVCSNYYFYDIENGLYTCFGIDETCESKGYPKQIDDIKQCFNSFEDCKTKGFKNHNNECYLSCPDNTNDIDDICLCSFFY